MARAYGSRSQMALAFENTYGTAPASGYTRMPFVSSALGAEQPLIDNELLGFGRDPLAPIKDAVTADGDVVVPIDAENFGTWLKAAFGAPDTTGSEAPYTHVFESGNYVLPSMAIEVGMPEVPRFAMYTGCRLDQLSFQMQRSGQLQATASLVAQGEDRAASSQAGTLAARTLRRFGQFNGAVRRNGTLIGNLVSAEVTYSNNLDRVETIRSDGRIEGADPTIAALTGTIELRFANETLVEQAVNGDASELEFEFTMANGHSFTLIAHEVYLPRPRIEITGPAGVQATCDWQAALNDSAGVMCTATLINETETYA